jgi:hypothetical protein
MSEVNDVTASYGVHFVSTDGGTRLQRAARIGAYARKHNLKRLTGKAEYSETTGFQTRTTIRYQER